MSELNCYLCDKKGINTCSECEKPICDDHEIIFTDYGGTVKVCSNCIDIRTEELLNAGLMDQLGMLFQSKGFVFLIVGSLTAIILFIVIIINPSLFS